MTIEKNSQRTPADKNKELEAVLRSHQTRIRVVGCGGGGNNTVTRLMEAGIMGVETLAINTDAQDLLAASADDKILIGKNITKGLGSGSNPQIGEDSARENQQDIEAALQNTDLVFVTCGLGGGTGTGSAPIVAEVSKKLGALTISVVTLPFAEEGVVRWENAKLGLEKLRQNSDTIIVIQNDRLFEVVPDLPLGMAFKVADEILVNAVKGITELITEKGLVNLDFADVRAVMQNGGTAMIGIGESDTTDGAQAAVELAMQNKLLEIDITGAKSALINVTGGVQMPLKDAKRVMQIVAAKLDASAKLIWGARIDPSLDKSVRVMLIVTGLPERRRTAAREERKLRADTPISAPGPAPEPVPGDNGVKQNLDAIGQLVESLIPEVQIATVEEPARNDNGQLLDKVFEPLESTAGKSSAAAEISAQNLDINATPKPKRKRKAKSSRRNASVEAVDMTPQIAEPAAPTSPEPVGLAGNDPKGAVPESKLATPTSQRQVIERVEAVATPQSRSEVTGKINPDVPPVKPRAPLPNVNQAGRPLNVNRGVPPQFKLRETITGREEIRRVANPGAPSVRSKAPMVNRQEIRRASNGQPLPPLRPRPTGQGALAPSPHANLGNRSSDDRSLQGGPSESRLQPPAANKTAPVASNAANYNKLFEAKSLANLQTIRESIGHLFIDPTRQETLRCMKSAATAINNLAQRFAFREIADYAATVEAICVRVLDGEINMNKKILNAFTEMPGIFEGMIHGDADAMTEAKRHQERLKRLADSLVEGEVLQTTTSARAMPRSPQPPTGGSAFSKPAATSPGPEPASTPVNKAAQQHVRPQPANDVMEYLDNLFSEAKPSPGR